MFFCLQPLGTKSSAPPTGPIAFGTNDPLTTGTGVLCVMCQTHDVLDIRLLLNSIDCDISEEQILAMILSPLELVFLCNVSHETRLYRFFSGVNLGFRASLKTIAQRWDEIRKFVHK